MTDAAIFPALAGTPRGGSLPSGSPSRPVGIDSLSRRELASETCSMGDDAPAGTRASDAKADWGLDSACERE